MSKTVFQLRQRATVVLDTGGGAAREDELFAVPGFVGLGWPGVLRRVLDALEAAGFPDAAGDREDVCDFGFGGAGDGIGLLHGFLGAGLGMKI